MSNSTITLEMMGGDQKNLMEMGKPDLNGKMKVLPSYLNRAGTLGNVGASMDIGTNTSPTGGLFSDIFQSAGELYAGYQAQKIAEEQAKIAQAQLEASRSAALMQQRALDQQRAADAATLRARSMPGAPTAPSNGIPSWAIYAGVGVVGIILLTAVLGRSKN